MLYEARWPRCDQVTSSWWSDGDVEFDAQKVRDHEAKGYVVKAIALKR